jgi:hypothetical protein
MIDDQAPVVQQMPKNVPLERLDNDTPTILPASRVRESRRIKNYNICNLNGTCTGTNQTYPQPITLVKYSSAHRLNELIFTAAPFWCRKVLASLTMYGELSAARLPKDFAAVRARLQQEWTFNAGFVS